MQNALQAPDRLLPVLKASCSLLAVIYIFMVVTTIFFASWQSQAVNSVRNIESSIGNLESQYYSDINKVSSENPSSLGFVAPTDVEYVAASSDNASNLSFAGK